MTEIRRSLPSLLLYAAGLAALMTCDLAASAWLEFDDLSTWSRVRSLFYFYGSLILMGVDQILVRRPRLAPVILAMFRWQLPVFALILSATLSITGYLPFGLALTSALTAGLSSIGNLLCLGRDQRTAAQYYVQIWKPIALAAVGAFLFGILSAGFASLLTIGFGLAAMASGYPLIHHARRQLPSSNVQRERVRWAYRLGRRYVLSTSLAAMTLYAETLLLNLFASPQAAAGFFAHLTFFALPLSAVGGYLSFIGVPLMRRRMVDPARLNWTHLTASIAVVATLTLAFQLLGWIAWRLVDPAIGEIITTLWLITAFGAFLRLLYIPLSVYFSIYGEVELHNRLIVGQIIAISVAAMFLVVMVSSGEIAALISIPLAGLVHLTLRVLFGGVLISRHARSLGESNIAIAKLSEASDR